MGKLMKLEVKGKICPNELKVGLKMFLERPNSAEVPCEPPANLNEFEDRLGQLLMSLGNLFFGLTYEVETGKTLKREKTSDSLVKALCNHEKYCQNNNAIFLGFSDHYQFLKLVLENDAPLFNDIYILGVRRDRSGLTDFHKNKIIVQAAAQVLWYLEKNKIPNIETMKKELMKKGRPLSVLIGSQNYASSTIEDWIREIFPVPKGSRKGRPSKKGVSANFFKELISIPEIFLEDGQVINFLKLRFVIICLTRVLKTFGWSQDQIYKSDFIHFYLKYLRFYPREYYIRDWVYEAFAENGSIFDP